MKLKNAVNIGIIGTGFIGQGLLLAIQTTDDMRVSKVLTRRKLEHFPNSSIHTNSLNELLEYSEIIVECSGDTVYSTDIIAKAMEEGIPIITMNSELHVTSGSYLITKGFITEAAGDQPGCLAELAKEIKTMGFTPLVYGNLKGFLNPEPTKKEMEHWAKVQGFSLNQVIGFTDGTKLHFEQALVANGLEANILKQGMAGIVTNSVEKGALELAQKAKDLGHPISDYLLSIPNTPNKLPPGVFITAENDGQHAEALNNLKMGEGPYYTFVRPFHLCHLEIPKTIQSVKQNNEMLLNNSAKPSVSVATIAKKDLLPGTKIADVAGSLLIRGEAIKIHSEPNHLPFGLVKGVVTKERIDQGQMIRFSDVEVPESLAYHAWQFTLGKTLA